jgi:hypothetical protein
MRQRLPEKDFKIISDSSEIESICMHLSDPESLKSSVPFLDKNLDLKESKGYFLDVDLEYPTELQEKHIGLPLA